MTPGTPKADSIRDMIKAYLDGIDEELKTAPRVVVPDSCPPELREKAQRIADVINGNPAACADEGDVFAALNAIDGGLKMADLRDRLMGDLLWGKSDG